MRSHYRNSVWNDHITVYHRTEQEDEYGRAKTFYVRTTYDECFFNHVQTLRVSGNVFVIGERYVVRIPADKNAIVSQEDLIVKGEVLDEVGNGVKLSDIKDKYSGRCFTVSEAKDDTKLTHTAHLKITGE